jgi:carbonic anhydrase
MKQINKSINRRTLLKLAGVGSVSLAATAAASTLWYPQLAQAMESSPPQATPEDLSPEAALQKLLEGNQRFVQEKSQHPDQSRSRLQAIAQKQSPFATLLTCADSRVAPEVLFDQGMGDIFDIRVAGNVVSPTVLGSLEYAVAMLNTPLIMVLGHERCGAVTAAVEGERLPGHISSFTQAIKPALKQVKNQSGDAVENGVVANVAYQIEQMKRNSTILAQQVLEGKLKIVGGRYDLDSGEVRLI